MFSDYIVFVDESGDHGIRLTHVVVERRGKREDAELELAFRKICDGANFHNCHLPFEIVMVPRLLTLPACSWPI
jgi:hypothetical protein